MDGRVLPNGYQIALACGPLKKARYINAAIEKELTEFKEEIAEKHAKSEMNKTYVFPRSERVVYGSQQEMSAAAMNALSGGHGAAAGRGTNRSHASDQIVVVGESSVAGGLARIPRHDDPE